MAEILIFGDSITYGAWDKEGGWASRLRKFLDEKSLSDLDLSDLDFYYLVYNLGISDDNTEKLLKRIEFETKQRMERTEEAIFIFAIGAGDSYFIHSQNRFYVEAGKFEKNIQKLIKIAGKFSSKIVFVGLIPVDESKSDPIPWDKDKSYKNEHIQKYDEIIKSVCKKQKVYFIEIFEKFKKLNYKKLLEDGLHPNSEGHKKIFEIVKGFLVGKKIIANP